MLDVDELLSCRVIELLSENVGDEMTRELLRLSLTKRLEKIGLRFRIQGYMLIKKRF